MNKHVLIKIQIHGSTKLGRFNQLTTKDSQSSFTLYRMQIAFQVHAITLSCQINYSFVLESFSLQTLRSAFRKHN
jgi:hypothetical protein